MLIFRHNFVRTAAKKSDPNFVKVLVRYSVQVSDRPGSYTGVKLRAKVSVDRWPAGLVATNNSDMMTDYVERDHVTLRPGDQHFMAALQVADEAMCVYGNDFETLEAMHVAALQA